MAGLLGLMKDGLMVLWLNDLMVKWLLRLDCCTQKAQRVISRKERKGVFTQRAQRSKSITCQGKANSMRAF